MAPTVQLAMAESSSSMSRISCGGGAKDSAEWLTNTV